MGRKVVKAIEWTCDGCFSIQVVSDEMEVYGYFGKVNHQHDSGGNSADWFACKADCIVKAIPNALLRNHQE